MLQEVYFADIPRDHERLVGSGCGAFAASATKEKKKAKEPQACQGAQPWLAPGPQQGRGGHSEAPGPEQGRGGQAEAFGSRRPCPGLFVVAASSAAYVVEGVQVRQDPADLVDRAGKQFATAAESQALVVVTDTALAATVQPSPQEVKDILVDQQQGRGVAGELIVAEEDEQFGEEAQAEDDVEEGLGPFQQGLIAAGQQLENPHVAAKLHEVQKTDFITSAHQQRLFVGSQNNMPFQQDFIVANRQLEELHAGRIAARQQLVELHTLMQLQKGFGPTPPHRHGPAARGAARGGAGCTGEHGRRERRAHCAAAP